MIPPKRPASWPGCGKLIAATLPPLKITLPADLHQQAIAVADARRGNRRRAGSFDHSGGQTCPATDVPGAIAEVALHLFFDLPIDWEFLATDAGFCEPDVGGLWEVRATVRPGNRLYLFEREITPQKLAAPFAWILVDGATCHLRGWAMGREIISRGIRQQIQRAPSYFLANDRLRPFVSPRVTWWAAGFCANSAQTASASSCSPSELFV